jgi:Tfp pilus assembly protein PilO
MSAKNRRGSWLVTLPLALLAVGYLMFFYLPGRRAISRATDQVEEHRQVLDQSAGLLTAIHIAQQDAGKADRFVSGWEANCPPTRELSQLYGEVYALAEAAGARVTRFDPEAIERGQRIVKIPLKMGCQGRFEQVFAFLAGLEGTHYEVWITELRMEGPPENRGDASCELSLVVFAGNSENSDYVEQTD